MMKIFTIKQSIATLVLACAFGATYAQTKQVTVEKAGSLSKQINESEKNTITHLTVSGNINGSDILFLREMAGRNSEGKQTNGKLETLNLSNAKIVKGGGNYYSIKRGLSKKYYSPSEDDVVSAYMFYQCASLKNITLPTSAKTIEQYALSRCTALTQCTLPESLENIREYAFAECKALATISELPEGLSEIGTKAFYNTAITAYQVAEGNENYEAEDGVLYYSGKSLLVLYPTGSTAETIKISSECGSIESYAFACAKNLKSITLPEGISEVGKSAFEKSGVTSVTFDASTASLKESAFQDCSNLQTVTFKANADMAKDAFKNCYKLTTVNICGGSVPECNATVFTPGNQKLHIYVPSAIVEQCKTAFTQHQVVKGSNYDILDIATSGITKIGNSTLATEKQHFNVLGKKIDKNIKGLHIIRLSNGSTIKRVVK